MRWCPKCGKPAWTDARDAHVCPPMWLVWDEDNEDPDEDDGSPVYAVDASSAAESYAEGMCTADGVEPLRLLVVAATNLEASFRFVVDPECEVTWTAHRAEEVEPR